MKKIFAIVLTIITTYSYSQIKKDKSEDLITKMEVFSSKTGVITKFVDVNLNSLKASYVIAKTRIRKIESGNSEGYFYQIEKPNKYGSSKASIEYSDLLEIIKAFNNLKTQVAKDINSGFDYLENKFITEDGFQLGYYVSKGKVNWYIKLEKYGSDTTLFIKDIGKIELNFMEAKSKIEELKK